MYRNKNNRGGGAGRQNAKQMSMNRFKEIDADLGSRFDDLYEEEEEETRNAVANRYLNRNVPRPGGRNQAGSYEQKKNVQQLKGAGGSAVKEFVSKVRVTNGSKYGQRFILKALIGHVEDLKPIMPNMAENGDFEFFVREADTAQAIRSCSRRIKHAGTGERLNINVHNTVAPWAKLKKEEKDAIAEVVGSRADPQNRALELSGFATHEAFTTRDLMMNMTKNNVFLAVVELIESKYSDIVALSLKNNRIKYLEMASMLPYFAKNLKVLDLSDNQIESISELEKLKGLRLTTLFLENNPVCENYSKASDYLSDVQAIFPRVTRLDGNECSALPGAFDDDNEFVEPPARPGFYGDAALRSIVETFIIEFFKAYDGDEPTSSRKNLVAAYDDSNSQFTLCIENLYEEGSGKTRWPNENFAFHIRMSHNIKQVEKWSKNRASRLFHGAMDVAAQLCKMPATRHLTESFIVDVVLSTSSLLIFSVQGLFEEAPFAVHPNLPQLNFFSRTFTVTPKENGSICVISDELYLTAMTHTRVERYKIQLGKANAAPPATAPAALPAAVAAAAAGTTVPDEATRAAMVEAFCRESGMLPEWSTRCLVDSDWDFAVAGQNFLAMKDKIPKEAFVVQ
ncbi:hypothetical protein PENTCL1PPCAC_61 [Pristionchus entomophagus]|uniref:Nuclear RNA export factor 1 n=1 Tax=Pristionchus entomophagus TaxID=358040 RepID=A0AAV5SDY4_9BILA|nr:hypothetical protein PENTCL1PPCAC_61 [Pristionchus entomophagus]